MRIKFVSDFHTEMFGNASPDKFERVLNHYFPPCPEDYQTTLCCAGDMGTYKQYAGTYKPLFAILSKRFKHVIIVPGNHSWYSSSGVWGNEVGFWMDKKLPKNVWYLDNQVKVIEGVAFIGSCLWTSFNNRDPLAMWEAQRNMNDFQTIKKQRSEIYGDYGRVIDCSKLTPEDTVVRYEESVRFIQSALRTCHDEYFPCVVVTHHAPSERSVGAQYKGDTLNAAYVTDLENLIETYAPQIWCHGHMHDSKDYMIGETRVICNPLGYHAVQINRNFNPDLVVEL